jgi:hypothetical protein
MCGRPVLGVLAAAAALDTPCGSVATVAKRRTPPHPCTTVSLRSGFRAPRRWFGARKCVGDARGIVAGAAGGRPAPPPEIDPRSWGSAATGLESRPRPRRQRSNVADDASPQSSAEIATGSSTGTAAGAFYRAERSQTVAPEEDDGWFVAQQSALENDLRRLQTNAESGHQQAVRRAKEAETRAEHSRRQMEDVRQRREAKQRLYEAQQAEQEQEQRRQQIEFEVQARARSASPLTLTRRCRPS